MGIMDELVMRLKETAEALKSAARRQMARRAGDTVKSQVEDAADDFLDAVEASLDEAQKTRQERTVYSPSRSDIVDQVDDIIAGANAANNPKVKATATDDVDRATQPTKHPNLDSAAHTQAQRKQAAKRQLARLKADQNHKEVSQAQPIEVKPKAKRTL